MAVAHAELMSVGPDEVVVTFTSSPGERVSTRVGGREVTTVQQEDWQIFSLRVESGLDVREEVFKLAAARHWTLRELSQKRATLEDVFVEITHSDQPEMSI